jgi:hypothetical protein
MRWLSWSVLVLLVLLAPTLASAQGVDLTSGQKVSTGMGDASDTHLYRFHAIAGDVVTIKFAVPGKSDLDPYLRLIGPEDVFNLPDLVKGKMKLDKLVIPESGLHLFTVAAAGTEGAYEFSFKQKHEKIGPESVAVAAKYSVMLPAGAKVKFEVKAEKGTDLYPGIDQILGPVGNDVLDPAKLKEKKKKAKVTIVEVPVFGWYTVYISARQGTGNAVVKTTITAAKPWRKKLKSESLCDSMVSMVRSPIGGGGWEYELNAEAFGPGTSSAFLRFPAGSGLLDEPLVVDDDDLRYTIAGTFPDGIYTIFITLTGGATIERRFVLEGSWPDPVDISMTNGSTATPTVSWTGGNGASVLVLYVLEDQGGGWEEEYFTLMPGTATSDTAPDGPLDPVAHAVQMYAISSGLKATASSYGL